LLAQFFDYPQGDANEHRCEFFLVGVHAFSYRRWMPERWRTFAGADSPAARHPKWGGRSLSDLDSSVLRLAHKNETAVANAIADVTQARVASLMGLGESTVSEWRKAHLSRMCAMLAACGLRIVPSSARYYSDAHITALKTLARQGLEAGSQEEFE
jgi:hypothetical protein